MNRFALLTFAIILVFGRVGVSLAEPADATSSGTHKNPNSYNEAWSERVSKINDRVQRKKLTAACKAEAKRKYAAIHFQKRRMFVKDCVAGSIH